MRSSPTLLRRFTVSAALALLCCPLGSAQGPGSNDPERHHWIVMLDVSASFEKLQASSDGGAAGLPGEYKLRNELPSLLYTLLAALNRAEGGAREDYLSVYFFGRGVHRVDSVQAERVQWGNERSDAWWEARQRELPAGIRARSELDRALEWSVQDFSNDTIPNVKRHLILVSDGELDVGLQGRRPGAPPGEEELAAYDQLLDSRNGTIGWLQSHGVAIHTLAVDEKLRGSEDRLRQLEIRSELASKQLGGTPGLERARSLIRERMSTHLPYVSEGPFVMQAIAEGPGGSGTRSRSVNSDNLYKVLWETFFPETPLGRYVAPGTRMVLVLARTGEPVVVSVEGSPSPVTLRYDLDTNQPAIIGDTNGRIARVNARRSAQHVTWVIESNHIVGVTAGADARIVPINDVELRWRPGRPPRSSARGQTVPVEAELLWTPQSAGGDDLATWRERMRRSLNEIDATLEVSSPGAREPVRLTLRPVLADDSSSVILSLQGQYTGTQTEGTHEMRGVLIVGTGDRRWEERLPSTLLEVTSQPAARPRLLVSAEVDGERTGAEQLTPLPRATPLRIGKRAAFQLHFTAEPGGGTATGGVHAPEAVPDYLSVYGAGGEEITRAMPLPGEQLATGTRYRFAPLVLPDSVLGDTLQVRIVAGPAAYDYGFVVSTDPWWRRWLLIAAAVLLALVAAAALLFFRRREPILPFDFVVDQNGHLVAPPGKRKSFVVEPLPDDQIRVLSEPSKGADAVRFSAANDVEYRLAPAGPHTDWKYRKVKPGEERDFFSLGAAGDTMDERDVIDGWRYQLRLGDGGRVVEIRSRSQSPLPLTDEFTRTRA
jgi:hypothetical protein